MEDLDDQDGRCKSVEILGGSGCPLDPTSSSRGIILGSGGRLERDETLDDPDDMEETEECEWEVGDAIDEKLAWLTEVEGLKGKDLLISGADWCLVVVSAFTWLNEFWDEPS